MEPLTNAIQKNTPCMECSFEATRLKRFRLDFRLSVISDASKRLDARAITSSLAEISAS